MGRTRPFPFVFIVVLLIGLSRSKLSEQDNKKRISDCGQDQVLPTFKVDLILKSDPSQNMSFSVISPNHVLLSADRLATWNTAMKSTLNTDCTDGVKVFDYKLQTVDGADSSDKVTFIGPDCTGTQGIIVAEIALDSDTFVCLSEQLPAVGEVSAQPGNAQKLTVSTCDLPSGFCITEPTDTLVGVHVLTEPPGETSKKWHLVGVTNHKRASDNASMINFVKSYQDKICEVTGICEIPEVTSTTDAPTTTTTEEISTTLTDPTLPPPNDPITFSTIENDPSSFSTTSEAPSSTTTEPTAPLVTSEQPEEPENTEKSKVRECGEDELCLDADEIFGDGSSASGCHLLAPALFVLFSVLFRVQ